MPLISFSGTTSQGSFWRQILDGRKTQTCRKPRKRPIKKGDRLFLYWKCRVPSKNKPIHFIGEATCVKIGRRQYGAFAFDDNFARRDGFKNHLELQLWFGDPFDRNNEGDPLYKGDVEYDVIHFKLIKKGEVNENG